MAIGARKQPLYDQLVDILTEKIDHEYRAGDMIPSERELSERYGLSRTTVRLALQELERLGLVVRQHGRGTFVTDRSAQLYRADARDGSRTRDHDSRVLRDGGR